MNSIKKLEFIIKKALVLSMLLLFGGYVCHAQSKRTFVFAAGDEFEKQSILKSTTNIQRGTQKLLISSSSTITKLYKVTEAADTAARFDITIKKMDNVISALGQLLHYDSEKGVDSTSKIQKSLNSMLNKPVIVKINKNGKILSSDESALETINDSLLVFAGIQSEPFNKGSQFSLTPNFTMSDRVKQGYFWMDTVTTDQQKMISRFWIDDISEGHTIIKFQSKLTSGYLNSNTTGTYVLDNHTGMIIQRLVQSISNGYQVMNSLVYITNRSISLSEEITLRPVKGRGPTPIDPDMTVKTR